MYRKLLQVFLISSILVIIISLIVGIWVVVPFLWKVLITALVVFVGTLILAKLTL